MGYHIRPFFPPIHIHTGVMDIRALVKKQPFEKNSDILLSTFSLYKKYINAGDLHGRAERI